MPSIADKLQRRTCQFSGRLLKLPHRLPRDPVTDTIVRQLTRAGTGIGSNYHSTRHARSRPEFITRLVVVEEADESAHWIERLHDTALASGAELEWLLDESKQLRAIFSRSLATTKRNHAAQKNASTGPSRQHK